jgi:hypothetical protein
MSTIEEVIEARTKSRPYNPQSKIPRPTETSSSTASANTVDVAVSDEGELIDKQLEQPVRKRARNDNSNGVDLDTMTDEKILRLTHAIQTRATFLEANNALRKVAMAAEALTVEGEGSNQGTFSSSVMSIAMTLSVQPQLVFDITIGKFNPYNITRLSTHGGGTTSYEDDTVPRLIDGKLSFTHSHAKLSDFKGDDNR